MKQPHFLIIIILSALFSNSLFADWRTDLDSLLKAERPETRDRLLQKVVAAAPDYSEVYAYLKNIAFPESPTDIFLTDTIICADGLERPWLLYVPPGYNPSTPTPLFVVLHDQATREKLIENPEKYGREHAFQKYIIEKNGWLALYPFAQKGAAWWDPVSLDNIKKLLRIVKSDYNVDDNRVYLGGIGDGASGVYTYAMLDPTDFAAFIGLKGDFAWANRMDGLPTYLGNLFNTFIYAGLTSQRDFIPSSSLAPMLRQIRLADAKIKYGTPEAYGDSLAYDEQDYERIRDYLQLYPRPAKLPYFTWTASDSAFGRFQWFAIEKINKLKPASWHIDYNAEIFDSSTIFDFVDDDRYSGPGVRIPEPAAAKIPDYNCDLRAGDVILKGNGLDLNSAHDFQLFKSQLHPGSGAVLTVDRHGQTFVIHCRIPPARRVNLFTYDRLSAAVRVTRTGNIVNLDASRLRKFSVLINPSLFAIEKNLQIIVEGKIVLDQLIEPDLPLLLNNFLENRDRQMLYIARITIEL